MSIDVIAGVTPASVAAHACFVAHGLAAASQHITFPPSCVGAHSESPRTPRFITAVEQKVDSGHLAKALMRDNTHVYGCTVRDSLDTGRRRSAFVWGAADSSNQK